MPIVIGVFEKLKLKLASYGEARRRNKALKQMNTGMDKATEVAMKALNGGTSGPDMEVGTAHQRTVTAQEIYEGSLKTRIADRQYEARGYAQFRAVADKFNPASPSAGHVVSGAEWRKVFAVGGMLDDMMSLLEEQGLSPTLYFITYPGNRKLKRVECVHEGEGNEAVQVIWLDAS